MEITFYNPSGELTFSGDAITYSYIGKATPTGISQAGTSSVSNTVGRSTYTITWDGDIVVALPLKTNGPQVVLSTVKSGSTWTIAVMKGNGSFDSNGFPTQEYTEVYVFGAPPSTATSQFMIYDVNGVPCGDLSRQPLLYKAIIALSSSVTDAWTPSPAITSPAVVGNPLGYRSTSVASGSKWINRVWGFAWSLGTDGQISRGLYVNDWSSDDGPIAQTLVAVPGNAIITTVQGLS
jgi:hypothetical protein